MSRDASNVFALHCTFCTEQCPMSDSFPEHLCVGTGELLYPTGESPEEFFELTRDILRIEGSIPNEY